MLDYHDHEWGHELRGDVALYERMSLEAFQSGLSWAIILRKRDGFRSAFGGFDPEVVAAYGPADVDRLLADAAIVRNRLKIDATISNARTLVELDTSFSDLLWSFAPADRPAPSAWPMCLPRRPSRSPWPRSSSDAVSASSVPPRPTR